MKNKWIYIGIFALFIIGGILYKKQNFLEEDTLYSQSILKNEDIQQRANSNYISRVEAIGRAYDIYREGLGINLYSPEITMYINLYHDTARDEYQWLMSWYRESNLDSYCCTISAEEGQILSVYVNEKNDSNLNAYSGEEHIDKFLNVLGYNLSDYIVKSKKYKIKEENQEKVLVQYSYVNQQDSSNQFIVEWEQSTGLITTFEVIRESIDENISS